MKYSEIIRLYEKKDHLIKRTNMTDEQKQEVIEFFSKHREQESQISGDEWNKPELLTYERFKQVMDAFNNRQTKSKANKIANKVGIAGLTEGEDYVDWGEFNDELLGKFHAYTPLTHLGAKTIAGKTVKPVNPDKDSACWCIGWSGNDSYWKNYFFKREDSFLVLCGENILTKKVCIEIKNVDVSIDNVTVWVDDVTVWNYYDVSAKLTSFIDSIFSDKDSVSNAFIKTIITLCKKAKDASDNKRDTILKDEKKRKEEEIKSTFLERTQGLKIKNLTYRGYNFPMVEMGIRPEGKVFGSYYLTAHAVPFSPYYEYESYLYEYGCNHWDISIVRQWLNSDEPKGQWYKEYEVDGYKVDWKRTPDSTKSFIRSVDGFLKIIGLEKSQLNPVKNVTYTIEGKEIITEDYVWIPSLTELTTENDYIEGQPLDYWEKVAGNNGDISMNSCNFLEPDIYWTRSADTSSSYSAYDVWSVNSSSNVESYGVRSMCRLPVLMCFKS